MAVGTREVISISETAARRIRTLYDTSMITKGFVFNNPNAKTTCGCGSSFGA